MTIQFHKFTCFDSYNTCDNSVTTFKHFRIALLITVFSLLCMSSSQVAFASSNLLNLQGTDTGTASWYGPNYAGKLTANGEIYNPRELTAAHQSMAFNTILRVTNLENGKSVNVRINDRGPFIDNRIIDLSEAAAEHIDMKYTGLARVQLTILQAGDPPPDINPVNPSNYSNTVNAITPASSTSFTNSANAANALSSQHPALSQMNDTLANTTSSNFQTPVSSAFQTAFAPVTSTAFTGTSTIISRPYNPVKPLPFEPVEASSGNTDRLDGSDSTNDNSAYSFTKVTKYSAIQSPGSSSHFNYNNDGSSLSTSTVASTLAANAVTTNTESANTFQVDTIAGLTLQEVIIPNYPIGTQFLLGSSNGNKLWVQVISNQLPPHLNNTLLISKELLNVLGKDLRLLEQQ